MNVARILMLGGLTAGLALPFAAQAQTTTQTAPLTTPQSTPGASQAQRPATVSPTRTDDVIVAASELEYGANSYTEGQARGRLEEHGFSAITNLRRDDNGLWRATASRSGTSSDVAMDFRGRIAHGAGVATIGPRPAAASTTGTTGTVNRAAPDGTPGNPPGTAVGRALGTSGAPDGTPGNPPGTAVGRALGTTGAPDGAPDGTRGNPPSTAVGRAVDGTQGRVSTPDGTPGNPAGTAAGRAVDRATGTNTPGATPGTPPGTPPGTTPAPAR